MYLRCWQDLTNLVLGVLYGSFAWSHWNLVHTTGKWWTIVPVLVQESLLALAFLARNRPTSVSPYGFDWVVGVVDTFLPLTIRPGGAGSLIGVMVQWGGFTIAISGLLSLGGSLGIVAANRGVQTRGAYQVVRHPMYLGHILCLVGYLVLYPSLRNWVIVSGTLVALLARMVVEEAWLSQDPQYRAYRTRVRWRLVPGVW